SQASERPTVIGHMLSNGKIRCPHPNCRGITFGRNADFRRHYTNHHASAKQEFWCTELGCNRSPPVGGGRGRSFGNRKDKRDEHLRNLH
ncbi:hypothetical protein K469DRAFT_497458, partial [Zopfia rhizophila CBS 207.26]